MIDCKITENYFEEKERMCNSFDDCYGCPLEEIGCNGCRIELVQEWSDQHPKKQTKNQ